MKSKTHLFLLLFGYISSLVVYLIWYYKIWHYSQYENITDTLNIEVITILFGITALYLFLYYLILSIRSFQMPWISFFLVLITTLLTFYLIPSVYYAKYQFIRTEEKIYTGKSSMKEMEAKLTKLNAKNNAAKKFIAKLQVNLESKHKENDKLRKQLNETIRKMKSLEEEHKIKGYVALQAKSNKDFSEIKINSGMDNNDSDTKNQGIIFKVQIIASSTRLSANSPEFKGLKNVWEYRDSGLYKYTVGNQKDLKSAYRLQSEFRRKGFVGAFVVAFKNGKRIRVREATKLLN